jgi:hypothetical protein
MCGLEDYADAIVGSLGVKHRKRTTIGVELAAKVCPYVLLSSDMLMVWWYSLTTIASANQTREEITRLIVLDGLIIPLGSPFMRDWHEKPTT